MPKLERIHQPIFGSEGNNDEFAVFGSMKSGTPVYSKTLSTLFQSPAFLQGWQDAVVADKAPWLEERNGVDYAVSSQLAYLFQKGLPEWDPDTTYYANTSFCQANGVWYQSVTDENIGNNPEEDTNETNWKKVSFGDPTGGGRGRCLGEAFISPHILEGEDAVGNALAGTYTLPANTAFYAKCVKEKEAGTEQTITVGEYSFTGYVYNQDKIYFDISEKPAIDSIYDATGKAFYYGIDTENQRIFLPRLKNVFIGMGDLTDTIRCKGNDIALGYDNGTLKFGTNPINSAGQGSIAAYTSLYGAKVGTVNQQTTQYSNGAIGLDTNSEYSGVVVDGQTIIDNAQPAYLYFCVGNTLVNTANIDAEKAIGEIRNLENNKADKTQVDGSWTKPLAALSLSGLTIKTTSKIIDVSAAIPADEHDYFACINMQGTPATAGTALIAATSIGTSFQVRSPSTAQVTWSGYLCVPANRQIILKTPSSTFNNVEFNISAIRRLGKNI